MKKRFKLVCLLGLLIFVLSACGAESTPVPKVAPSISEIQGPDEVDADATVSYVINVDVDATYNWREPKGAISSNDNPGILYTAPNTGGTDLLIVEITINGTKETKTKEIKIIPPIIVEDPVCVLENFNNGTQNKWFSPDEDVFDYGVRTDPSESNESSFLVNYNKSDTYQFIAFEQNTCDFSQARKLEVRVYGDVDLLLKLEDWNLDAVDVSEKRAGDPEGWTQLVFDYTNAGNSVDLANIKSVMFFVAPGDAQASGEFYMDDIMLFP